MANGILSTYNVRSVRFDNFNLVLLKSQLDASAAVMTMVDIHRSYTMQEFENILILSLQLQDAVRTRIRNTSLFQTDN